MPPRCFQNRVHSVGGGGELRPSPWLFQCSYVPGLCSDSAPSCFLLLCRYKISWDQFTHRLVLPTVRLSDAGEYTAVAGSNMSRASLGVEGRDVRICEPANRNISVSSLTAELRRSGETVGSFSSALAGC